MYDVIIIGAGVSGAAAARELSRYRLKICVLEREEDVCCGTSKANSGIAHSGYDAEPGSLMAELNVKGSNMMGQLSKELDFPFKQTGSLTVCTTENGIAMLHKLRERGLKNGVEGLRILDREEALAMEPNLSDEVVAAIYCPTGGIVCPFGMNIAFAENAAANGVEFLFNTEVKEIQKEQTGYILITQNGEIHARCVVNAAGVYADVFHNMVSENKIHITPRRGEYELLDRAAGGIVDKTIFQLPGKYGKGVLVTPTVHGNILIGPTADDHDDKDGTNTTRAGLAHVTTSGTRSVPSLPMRQVITSFAGNRAHEDGHEFIIEELKDAPFFVDCAGIESPGLSSAPAIGERVAAIVERLFKPSKNADFIETRKGILNPKKLSEDEYKELIKEKPEYGNIICRCEMITEGEIMDAVNRPLGAKSLDGVKRRTRAGMGRCQAGFCSPRTMEIIARERGISQLDITKSGGKSKIVVGMSKNRG